MCFVPLIWLFLPQRMAQLAPDDSVRMLSWALLLGAIAASLANILAGAISDRMIARRGSRMPLIAAGLAATMLSFVALAFAASAEHLIAAFLAFQLAFNVLFAPMAALITDHVADRHKGRVFGLLGLALPLSQAALFLIVQAGIDALPLRLGLVAIVALACFAPLVWLAPFPAVGDPESSPVSVPGTGVIGRDFALAWFARLFVQCGSVAVGSYLFVHLVRRVAADPTLLSADAWTSRLALLSAVIGLGTGMVLGAASDRTGRRRPFLSLTALCSSAGCAALAFGQDPALITGGAALFALGLAGFLTVDGAMVAQLVGTTANRGAALGIMNLTNTVSGILVPGASLALDSSVPVHTNLLFGMMAAAALAAAGLVLRIRSVD